MSLELFGHPFSSYTLEGADRALGRRDAVRISNARRRPSGELSPSSSGIWPFGKFPLLVDDGEPVIETTSHHRTSAGASSRARTAGSRTASSAGGSASSTASSTSTSWATCKPVGRPCASARRHRAIPTAPNKGARTSAHRLRLARGQSRRRHWAAGEHVHARRLRRRAVAVLRRLGRGDRRRPAEARGLSRAAARRIRWSRERSRRPAVPPLFPARRARPRLSESRRLPQQLIGLDHLAEARPRACGRRRSCRGDSGAPGSNSAGAARGGRRPRRGRAPTARAARPW